MAVEPCHLRALNYSLASDTLPCQGNGASSCSFPEVSALQRDSGWEMGSSGGGVKMCGCGFRLCPRDYNELGGGGMKPLNSIAHLKVAGVG